MAKEQRTDKLKQVVASFGSLFNTVNGGFESFITLNTDIQILEIIARIEKTPITYVQLNQIFSLAYMGTISDGFYSYYWSEPEIGSHIYNVKKTEDYPQNLVNKNDRVESRDIVSISHLRWGIRRIIIDSLFLYGNINRGFETLRTMSYKQLSDLFRSQRFDVDTIQKRGEPIEFNYIEHEDRYLISEMCCKTYEKRENLVGYLVEQYRNAVQKGVSRPRWKDLLGGKYVKEEIPQQLTLAGTADELYIDSIEDAEIHNENEIQAKCDLIAKKFEAARENALANTKLFLSLVHDLDVYVATSMRTRQNFTDMANKCKTIFDDERIKKLKLRYFDPTISAAESHEDKGIIECLMVKCCKVLIYCSGDKDSYGKDAEASMALSLGKPVIFLSENDDRASFAKNTHPLTRLVDFKSGVVNGAIVANNVYDVALLLYRIFSNEMEYEVKQKGDNSGYYLLTETRTGSVIRLQTNDRLLSHAFWNNYAH